ncbi:MAG: SDR family oxidoreductase [Lentisphaeria bacterium]|nr:SDR family oxidoreductase [Lentisphaeria bacterium]
MEYPEFQGKTAIATGAASGMALLFLQKMAENGANVVLCDVNIDGAEAEAAKIRAAGGNAIAAKVDVRKYDEIENAVALAVKNFGRVDFLLNSAGGNSQRVCKQSGGFLNASPESIEWGVDVNLKGAVLFTRAVLKQMFDQNFGVIINMGSIDGVTGAKGLDYTASKAGMIGLSQGTANLGAEHGVRSVCISPGPVMTRAAMANMKTLLGRAAEVIEVVNLMLYVCSDKGSFITGTNLLIDGGRSLAASRF